MEKKQTAVEWLVNTINDKIDYIPIKYWDNIRIIIEQAKEMEKEQIETAWIAGKEFGCTFEDPETAEQYYNETYKSQ
jgi:hypothetical protein